MSTKIPHGHRLAAGTDTEAFLAALPSVMAPVWDRLDMARIIEKALTRIDDADRRNIPRPKEPARDVLAEILAEETNPRNAGTVWSGWNEVSLSWGTDPGTGRTMLLLHATEQTVYAEALRSMPGVEPYPYWNNSDHPDDVTEAEWAERKAAWNRMIPRYSASDTMQTWELDRPASRVHTLLDEILSGGDLEPWLPKFNRERWVAINTYSSWLHATHGVDPMDCAGAAFRADLTPLTDIIRPALAPLDAQLLIDGAGENRLYPLMDQVRAACATVRDDD